ncbi:HlyD family secretion protein [Burkholderia anthina]|uniref:HlyD family secretion protein n=1 Tax=Burkholderia anthina TaxID=179879 RepID=UPI00158F1AC9
MSEPQTRKRIYLLCFAVVAVCLVAFGSYKYLKDAAPSTNDAYIAADFSVVAPRVSGQVTSVAVDDNEIVHRGQLLAEIDDRDYRAAVASAEANVSTAQAAVAHVDAQIDEQQAAIEQARASLASARAQFVFSRADFARYTDLAAQGAGSVQLAQQARSRIDSAQADVARNKAAVDASVQRVAVLKSERERAEGKLLDTRAALDTAQLNLSWTRIVAPIDGMVGQRTVRVGAYASAGTPLLAVVPLRDAYVVANFQETQLTHVRRGLHAEIRVDTLPGALLHGTVDSIAPATGVTFAPIAPENATGNFTKVVQRIPVKIRFSAAPAIAERLRAGMSVEVTVDTDSRATELHAENQQ